MAYDHRIPSQADLRGFLMVWLRAIALAWTACWERDGVKITTKEKCGKPETVKENGKDKLIDCAGCRFRADLLADAEKALNEWFNYALPFAIDFKVRLAEELVDKHVDTVAYQETAGSKKVTWKDITWEPDQFEGGRLVRAGRWGSSIPWTDIDVALPTKPEEYDEGIAMAAFVSSGPAYLFTCC